VANYDQGSGGGTGFVFYDLNPGSLADTIGGAVSTWDDRPEHIDPPRRRGMLEDHPGGRSAPEDVELYLAAFPRGRGPGFSGAPRRRARGSCRRRVARGSAAGPGARIRQSSRTRPGWVEASASAPHTAGGSAPSRIESSAREAE